MPHPNSASPDPDAPWDIAIAGAGAAGMAAAIFAAETAPPGTRILLLEGARRPGAKILVSGGGRCNVTNREVRSEDFSGGPSPIIRNVLRAFGERQTIDWMRGLGVELKLEPTGKYFPITDKARTVLDALLHRVDELGVTLRSQMRILNVAVSPKGFRILTAGGELTARRLIIATGGLALPKSGSDGVGLQWMGALGHRLIPTTPALAPLVLAPGYAPGGRFTELAGISMDARLTLLSDTGKKMREIEGALLFTHFGISGPAAMDMSRHLARWRLDHPGEQPALILGHPDFHASEKADQWLREQAQLHPKRTAAVALSDLFPERYARLLAPEDTRLSALTRSQRLQLARNIAALPLDPVGDRGYSFAETTAGGVDLREIDPRTMESRRVPGLYLCGEILDVDGRIGGFNFQWAWASGYLAGRGAAASLQPSD